MRPQIAASTLQDIKAPLPQRGLALLDYQGYKRPGMSKIESFESVWDAISDAPEQAANLRARAELMQRIAAIVKESGWTQAEAAKHFRVTQPRINDLLHECVSRFSLDGLVNIAKAIGRRVHFELEAA